jgi:Na+/melibiose symporter-like transporter
LISYLYFLGPILGYVIAIIAFKFYGITPAVSEKMLKEINERERRSEAV